MKPLLYDICCCAGGATKGYQEAGFRVIGIDNRPQRHYVGDGFILMDCLEFLDRYLAGEFERAGAFHASPPCQRYSEATPVAYRNNHPDLIAPIRESLVKTGKPFIIENVEAARFLLINPVMLCGTMFGLPLWRHRYFETSWGFTFAPASCAHERRPLVVVCDGSIARKGRKRVNEVVETPVLITGTTSRTWGKRDLEYSTAACRQALQTPWMIKTEMDEAIPPAYTEYLGNKLMTFLEKV